MIIKSYQKGDESSILNLFEVAFGKNMSLEYWNWRFANNPFSDKLFIELMWDNDTLVGHYAISPITMSIDGTIFKTALSMTTMTHPDYGGRGVFSQLAESLYSNLSKNDFYMVWGFPNNNSHYGFNKNLKWSDIAVQGIMSLSAEFFAHKINKDVKFELLKKFTSNEIALLNCSEKKVNIYKTEEYLNWRYFDNPTANYKVIQLNNRSGLMIYKTLVSFTNPNKYEVDIMDIEYDHDVNVISDLISALLIVEENVIKVNIWDSLFSPNQISLEKIGFRIGSPVTYLGYRNLQSNHGSEGIYKYWDLSLSYSDVF